MPVLGCCCFVVVVLFFVITVIGFNLLGYRLSCPQREKEIESARQGAKCLFWAFNAKLDFVTVRAAKVTCLKSRIP